MEVRTLFFHLEAHLTVPDNDEDLKDPDQLRESKIVELSKKCRRLTVSVEKERSRSDSLEQKNKVLASSDTQFMD